MVVFASLGVVFFKHELEFYTFFMAVMVVILWHLFSFRFFMIYRKAALRKVFMGVPVAWWSWLHCHLGFNWRNAVEEGPYVIRPVTALWLIAVPLIDMMAIMIRRIRKGHSPFHILTANIFTTLYSRIGFTPRVFEVVILYDAIGLFYSGPVGEYFKVPLHSCSTPLWCVSYSHLRDDIRLKWRR